MDFANPSSCGYTYVTFCKAPVVSFAFGGSLTGSEAEVTTMEYAMDKTDIEGITPKIIAAASATTYDFSTGGTWLLPPADVTATYFTAVDTSVTAGSVAVKYGGSTADATKYDDDVKAATAWEDAKSKYVTDANKYMTNVETYIGTYTDVLSEIWDDFIGKARTEEEAKAGLKSVGTKPTPPTVPTTTAANPLAADFDCAGKPCKYTSVDATSATRGFGVVGAANKADVVPIDYSEEAVTHYTVAEAKSQSKAWEFATDTCRPKIMHVVVNVKKDAFPKPGTTGTKTATVTFTHSMIKDLSELLIIPMEADLKDASLGVSGATTISDLDTYYKANGSSSLMASGLAAAVLALTLY